MNNSSSGKTVLVIILFILFIFLFAGGALGSRDLTPDTPPAQQAAFAAEAGAVGAGGGAAGSQSFLAQGAAYSPCGQVYTVQSGDTLSRIAANCAVTLEDILAANPSITDPHLIQIGQQIVLYPGIAAPAEVPLAADPGDSKNPDDMFYPAAEEPVIVEELPEEPVEQPPEELPEDIPDINIYPPSEDSFGPEDTSDMEEFYPTGGSTDPEESVDTVPTAASPGGSGDTFLPEGLVPGGVINVTVRGLPPTTALSIGIGKEGDAPTMIEDRITDENGELILRLAIPHRARAGEQWVVTVMTIRQPKTTIKSVPFTIQ